LIELLTENEDINSVLNIGNLNKDEYGILFAKKFVEDYLPWLSEYCFIWWQVLKYYKVNRVTTDSDILIISNNNDMSLILEILEKNDLTIIYYNFDDSNSNDPIWISLIRFVYEWVEIDILASKYEFQNNAIKNSLKITLSNGETAPIISLSDLIISKIYSWGAKDISDVDALIRNNYDYFTLKNKNYIYNTTLKSLNQHLFFEKIINNI